MRLAVLVAIVLCAHLAHAGNAIGIVIPPAEVDLGTGVPLGGATATAGPSTEVLAGVHWASLAWRPTPFDVGIGYVGSFRPVLPGYAARDAMSTGSADNELRMNGMYFDLAMALESKHFWRTWLAARGELLTAGVNGRSFSSLGVAARIATELYSTGCNGSGGHNAAGIVAGTFAVGVYVEASHRELSPELGPNAFSAGVSVRVPFIAAIAD
jgi:hypothetical protein